jgi:hypothetical protein
MLASEAGVVARHALNRRDEFISHLSWSSQLASEDERLMWFLLDASANLSNQVATVMSLAGD